MRETLSDQAKWSCNSLPALGSLKRLDSDNTYYVKFYSGRHTNRNATEFMQYLNPPGGGPSSNTCPKCAPHLRQLTSVRPIPKLVSACSATFSFAIGAVKLGHPVPDENFALESNSAVPQPTHL